MSFIPYADPTKAAGTINSSNYQNASIAPFANNDSGVQAAYNTPNYPVAAANQAYYNNLSGDTGGGGGATTPALDAAAIANTQKGLDQLGGILDRSLAANQQKYHNADQTLAANEQLQQNQYDQGSQTNQQNYDSNYMAALRAGAQGLGGLLSILRGTGAEGWANQAVRDTTAGDIREGLDTRQQNQGALDTSLSNFKTDLAGKRQENQDALQTNEFAARNDNATQMQDLYTKMAKFYADAGDNATATHYMNLAGDQSAQIAKYGVAPVQAFNASPVAVQAAPISAFAGPTEQAVNYSPGNSGAGAGLFTIGDARKRLAGVGA